MQQRTSALIRVRFRRDGPCQPRTRDHWCAARHRTHEGDSETVYVAFVRRAKGHKIARRVKTADILDNLNASRLSAVTEKDMRRMNRYLTALRELRDAEA